MDDYEKRIREKVFNAGILTNGEWVYLIGVFNAAREYEEALAKATPVSNGHSQPHSSGVENGD